MTYETRQMQSDKCNVTDAMWQMTCDKCNHTIEMLKMQCGPDA